MMRVVIVFLLATLLIGCINNSFNDTKLKTTTISEVKNNIEVYKGKLVKIEGVYIGWHGNESPPVTRSDWAIRDETGEIYVTGMVPNLDPCKDIGKNITVIGYIEVTENGRAYIRAVKIIY